MWIEMWVLIGASAIVIICTAIMAIVIIGQDGEIEQLYDRINGGDEE